jgi:hypothetical protein
MTMSDVRVRVVIVTLHPFTVLGCPATTAKTIEAARRKARKAVRDYPVCFPPGGCFGEPGVNPVSCDAQQFIDGRWVTVERFKLVAKETRTCARIVTLAEFAPAPDTATVWGLFDK